MDITPYVDSLRRDLLAAAEAAGPEAREATERLAFALDPAARLALMEAISQAAAEITAEMPDGGVDVRLNGRELDFVVARRRPAAATRAARARPGQDDAEDDGSVARITLRIPESVKARAEELAARSGTLAQHLAGQRRPRGHPRERDQRRHRPVQHPVPRRQRPRSAASAATAG